MACAIRIKKGVVGNNLWRWSLTSLFHLKSKAQHQPASARKVPNPYHAVSIACGEAACRAAIHLEGQRFLSAEAPPLPLQECDAVRCTCRYQHHADRRAGRDRRQRDVWISGPAYAGCERREKGGRRVTDH